MWAGDPKRPYSPHPQTVDSLPNDGLDGDVVLVSTVTSTKRGGRVETITKTSYVTE